jgi:hypothetical protein
VTGKHVEEVARGGPPQRRTGLAVGLAVLTGVLCVAVLILSGQRRAAVQARALLSETADVLQMYGPVEVEVLRPDYIPPNGPVETIPPLHWQLPAEYRLMVSGPNEADGVDFIAAKASTSQGITAEYWLAADGQWQTRVNHVLEELDLDLDLPSDMGDRGIVEYLLGFNAEGLRDQIARVREPVRKAEYYQRGLWVRHRCLVNLHYPGRSALATPTATSRKRPRRTRTSSRSS